MLERWVEAGVPAPESQCARKGEAITAAPAEESCTDLLAPTP